MQSVVGLDPWGPFRAWAACLEWSARMSAVRWTRAGGTAAIEAVRRERLRTLVEFARTHSAFYRNAYRDVEAPVQTVDALPVVAKRQLMAQFDDWVTDPRITRSGVESFLADRSHIGDCFLDRYVVWKSSGTTGEPGLFIQDPNALATYDTLVSLQLQTMGMAMRYGWGVFAQGGRAALITATGDHYAGIATWRRTQHQTPWISAHSYSVTDPLPQLVAALNACQPAFLASYPTVLLLLAAERKAGRLRISPVSLWSYGECLAAGMQTEIEAAFACPLENEYGASECLSIAFGCRQGWLHVNADWVVLEPVDSRHRPTAPGEPSHTVLLTNLANLVQPVIRYDLGDRVIAKATPCACGNPMPAIQVEGRRDDLLTLRGSDGSAVTVLPSALAAIVEEAAGLRRFQIVQKGPELLMLRLGERDGAERQAIWRRLSSALHQYLATLSLAHVRIELDGSPPAADARSGKVRQVIVEGRV
jgi:putative adenylate-forming enzyme